MSQLIHYTDPQSRGMRSQRILDVFQIPHQKVELQLRKGEHRTPEYGQINPFHRVPALRHGDVTVIESGAICLYLADLFPEQMRTPAVATPQRARLYEWLFFLQTSLEPHAANAFDPNKKDDAKKEIRQLLKAMEGKFEGPFALGEQWSVLDVILQTELAWYQMMDIYPDGLEVYDQFMERMKSVAPF